MSSCVMTKTELSVLLQALNIGSVPVGVGELPTLTAKECALQLASFLERGVLKGMAGAFVPDKALARCLLPMARARRVLVYTYRIDDRSVFNATVYLSPAGMAVLREDGPDRVSLIQPENREDLLLMLPGPGDVSGGESGDDHAVSFMLMGRRHSVLHCTRLTPSQHLAEVAEGRRAQGLPPQESVFSCSTDEYRALLCDMIKEVCDAAGC